MRILVIEDDAETAEYVAGGLAEHGHEVEVEVAADGAAGLARALAGGHELLIVDRMLPGGDGLGVVTRLRAAGSDVPVLFLSTLAGIDDRVTGLEAGGDDYLVKPFALPELLARVGALGRRGRDGRPTRVVVGALEIDLIERAARWDGRDLGLIPRELELLVHLARHAGRVVTKGMLLEHVWGFTFDPRTSVVETHLSRLRAKLERAGAGDFVQTVRGTGYVLRAPA